MADDPNQNTRSSPRAAVPLEVEVEVAGERRKGLLISRDIGAGGMFLRTVDPAPLFKRIRMVIRLPDGGEFDVTGEVVRCVSPLESREKKHPPGMAVAFDDVSRAKRKELIALVLDLCSRRPAKPQAAQAEAAGRPTTAADPSPPVPPAVVVRKSAGRTAEPVIGTDADPDDDFGSKTDALLGQLDDLLDAVEKEQAGPSRAKAAPAAVREVKSPPPVVEMPPPILDDSITRLSDFLARYRERVKGDTHYDLLLVDRKANAAQIEQAYQALLGKLKPPGLPEELPEALIRDLSVVLGKVRKAFAILGKPDRKRAYDFLIDNSDEEF